MTSSQSPARGLQNDGWKVALHSGTCACEPGGRSEYPLGTMPDRSPAPAELKGRAAPPGSTIGVVTPGSPAESRAEIERGIRWWESQGYRIRLMPSALDRLGWHAGSPANR